MAAATNSETITICLIGRTGSGKSTLGNVLLGYKPDGTSKSDGILSRGFQVGAGVELCTTDTELQQGHWLGDPSNPLVTIIDTPGHGGGEDEAESYRQKMVDFIRSLSKVDAIVYLRNADEPRFDAHDVETLRVFSEMFGREQFFSNLVIVISRWSFSAESEMRRKKSGANLEALKQSLKAKMESKYPGLCSNLPILALDAFYREEDGLQKEHFVDSCCQLFDTFKVLSAIPLTVQEVKMVEDEDKKLERTIKSLSEEEKVLVELHQQERMANEALFSDLQRKNAILAEKEKEKECKTIISRGKACVKGMVTATKDFLGGTGPSHSVCDNHPTSQHSNSHPRHYGRVEQAAEAGLAEIDQPGVGGVSGQGKRVPATVPPNGAPPSAGKGGDHVPHQTPLTPSPKVPVTVAQSLTSSPQTDDATDIRIREIVLLRRRKEELEDILRKYEESILSQYQMKEETQKKLSDTKERLDMLEEKFKTITGGTCGQQQGDDDQESAGSRVL